MRSFFRFCALETTIFTCEKEKANQIKLEKIEIEERDRKLWAKEVIIIKINSCSL